MDTNRIPGHRPQTGPRLEQLLRGGWLTREQLARRLGVKTTTVDYVLGQLRHRGVLESRAGEGPATEYHVTEAPRA